MAAMFFGQLLVIEAIEEEERRRRRRNRILRRAVRDAQDPLQLPESTFIHHFRLSQPAVLALMAIVEPYMDAGVRTTRIPKIFRVLAVLNFVGTGSYQREVASNVLACSSQSMVCQFIDEVIPLVVEHGLRQWVRFPRNDVEKNELKDEFQRRHRMSQIIGVVDGTHVAIVKPRVNEHVFINRKGYHSLNCQIICDANLRILNMVARWPGSSHDAHIWRTSTIGHIMRANYQNGDHDTRLMGDSGYPCLPWLLVPVPRPQTLQQRLYNDRFRRCRSVVERCIGVLKGRFRCLLKERTLHYSPNAAAKMIMFCAILHNIAIHFRVREPVLRWDNIDLEEAQPLPDVEENVGADRRAGQQRRQEYINMYFNQ